MNDFFPDDPAADVLRDTVRFTAEDVPMPFENSEPWETALRAVVAHYGGQIDLLNYIFCSDDYLHRINVEHLDHDTLTDIITFPYREFPELESDIFISTERVHENATERNLSFETELQRVMSHGLLHLIGFGDKTEAEATEMRQREEHAMKFFLRDRSERSSETRNLRADS